MTLPFSTSSEQAPFCHSGTRRRGRRQRNHFQSGTSSNRKCPVLHTSSSDTTAPLRWNCIPCRMLIFCQTCCHWKSWSRSGADRQTAPVLYAWNPDNYRYTCGWHINGPHPVRWQPCLKCCRKRSQLIRPVTIGFLVSSHFMFDTFTSRIRVQTVPSPWNLSRIERILICISVFIQPPAKRLGYFSPSEQHFPGCIRWNLVICLHSLMIILACFSFQIYLHRKCKTNRKVSFYGHLEPLWKVWSWSSAGSLE